MERRELVSRNIVIGQHVTPEKRQVAHGLRRQMTIAEEKLWLRLRGNRVGANFRRQQIIDGFIADFYCHSARLVIEVDGAFHDRDYDSERDRIFATRNILVLRFKNEQIISNMPTDLGLIRQTSYV